MAGDAGARDEVGQPRRGMLDEIIERVIRQASESGLIRDDTPVDAVAGAIAASLPEIADVLARVIHQEKAGLLAEHSDARERLRERIEGDYGTAFANYDVALRLTYDLASDANSEYADAAVADDLLPACHVLFLLHGRALTVAAEILHLLQGGFSDGATARYRTIHEIAVVMTLITRDRAGDLAQRYLDFAEVERFKYMEIYQESCDATGYKPYSSGEMSDARGRRDAILGQRGVRFERRNQWAAPLFAAGEDISFIKLERRAGLAHKRVFYAHANNSVHAGPQAALDNIHRRGGSLHIGAGPRSGEVIGEIAEGALIHLLHCTAGLIVHLQRVVGLAADAVLALHVLGRFIEDTGKSFHRASLRVQSYGPVR